MDVLQHSEINATALSVLEFMGAVLKAVQRGIETTKVTIV